jgi:DNA-binding NarL/FixJ family response regulator
VALRIVLGEDNLLVREGISRILEGEPNVDLVAACNDLPSLVHAVDREAPDVVLTDIRMPPGDDDEGIQLAALLSETHPRTGLVVLSNYASADYAVALMQSGMSGRAYLLKERVHNRVEIVSAIESVASGGSLIDPKIVAPLLAAQAHRPDSALAELTPREREVLGQIAEGKSNSAIAAEFVLTKRAVEKHINSIFLKLDLADARDVSKRVKAALLFLADTEPTVRV